MNETISIGELAAIEQAMTPAADWKSEPSWNNGGSSLADFTIPGHNGGATVEMLAADGTGIVAARKALPVLLEIARAALALEAAQGALVKSWIDPTSSASAALERDNDACRRARAAYTAALAKVRP